MVLVLLETQILSLNKVESAADRCHLGPKKICTSNAFESQLQANGLNVCVWCGGGGWGGACVCVMRVHVSIHLHECMCSACKIFQQYCFVRMYVSLSFVMCVLVPFFVEKAVT